MGGGTIGATGAIGAAAMGPGPTGGLKQADASNPIWSIEYDSHRRWNADRTWKAW